MSVTLLLATATASAGYFSIHEDARLPKAYAAVVTGGVLVGEAGPGERGVAQPGAFAGARVTILEGLTFVSRRWAIGVTIVDVTRDARDFGSDVAGGWVTGTLGYMTAARGRHFDFASLQVGLLPVASVRLYYTMVPLGPWPLELFACAGYGGAIEDARTTGRCVGQLAVGARVGLDMWVMREPESRPPSGFEG